MRFPVRLGSWSDFWSRYNIRKPLDEYVRDSESTGLRRTLGAGQLTALGVGAIVGAGVFSVTGLVAANHAGPSTALAFVVAAGVAALAALAYAELAAMIPLGGSAYTYAYAGMGELAGWNVAWALVLSYAVGNMAVASSFSDNVTGLLETIGVALPHQWTAAWGVTDAASGAVGVFDVPGFLVVALVTVVLLRPIGESATANFVLVLVKVGILLAFVVVGATRVDPMNWTPFMPNGPTGIFTGAAIIFFAFIGFDAISTAAEETKDPQRDLPRGIIGSLLVVTALFIAVGLVLTGIAPSGQLATGEPLAYALRLVNLDALGAVMNVGGLMATLSVLLVFQLATTRVFMAIARDGLFPKSIAKLSAKHGTPNRSTIALGIGVGVGSALVPLGILVELTNVATLFLFSAVMVAVLVLRRREPGAKRPFSMPMYPWLPAFGVVTTLALIFLLPWVSILGFIGWMGAGLMLYAAYGARRSELRRALAKRSVPVAGAVAGAEKVEEAQSPPR